MKKILLIAIFIGSLVILLRNTAFSDGKFYYGYDKIPPNIPYQRAILLFDNEHEVLILQSKYEIENKKREDSALEIRN